MPFEATVKTFATALADPAAPPPNETRGRLDAPDARRFSVYRNNVAVGLIGAIEARFPVGRRMVGEAGFRALARTFIESHKPRSPVLVAFGDEFPDFLAADASHDLPFLPDLARLENAWVEAYHAADASAATLANLATLMDPELAHDQTTFAPPPPLRGREEAGGLAQLDQAARNPPPGLLHKGRGDALMSARARFHPAARLLCLATPAASIWAAHQDGAEPAAPPPERGEDVLVTRPDEEVLVRILREGGYAFAASLRDGATFAEAAAALADPEGFGPHLVGLVEAGALASIIPGEPV